MSWTDDQIAMVDERIRAASKTTRAYGTVVTRDTTGPGATVRQDGALTPTPALCAGSVFCQPGDWVTLDLYGTQWVITNSFSGPGFGEASKYLTGLGATTGGLTSATFVDLSEVGTSTFNKFYDNTFVRIGATVSGYSDAVNTNAEWAVRLTPVEGGSSYTPADLTVAQIFFNLATLHTSVYATRRVLDVPAGSYTVSMRWRRSSGAGAVRSSADDTYALELDERVRASAPIL